MSISVIVVWKCSSGSQRFWLRKEAFFPAKLSYNDILHLGRFFYQSVIYSSGHQNLSWFCLIVAVFLGSPSAIAFCCALEILGKKSARERGKSVRFKQSDLRLKQIQKEGKRQKDWWEAFFFNMIMYHFFHKTVRCCSLPSELIANGGRTSPNEGTQS